MIAVYKLLLFFTIFALIAFGFYLSYRYLNKKIKASETGWGIVGYSLLMIAMNIILFFGGLYVLIWSYAFLSGNG